MEKPPVFTNVERDVDGLAQNAANPRTLKDKAFKELRRSLEKDPHFLKARPIIVSMAEGREGTVIAGNQRLAAAKSLGWKTVPVVEVRGATEGQEKEWMVKDNLHKGEWDFEKLAEGFDLDFLKDMGFDEKELNKVLANVDNSADDEFDAEKEAEAITEPIVKRGEIWQLGEHRLMCGDSTKKEDVGMLMDGKNADICLTDPPYGLDEKKKSGKNDYNEYKDTRENLESLIKGWLPIAKDVGKVVVFSPGVTNQWLYPEPNWVLCWFYGAGSLRSPWGFNCWQPFLCYGKDPSHAAGNGSKPDAVNMNTPANGKALGHPCPKPIQLWEWLIMRLSYSLGDLFFEPFAGSGTTIIACENLGRICYGMEIDPKYCDVIIKRWEEKTGKKAVKASV